MGTVFHWGRNRANLDKWEGKGGKCGLLSAKGGLMMGTKKVGALSSPQKRTNINYI